jgi:hypothetical protein
MPGAPFFGSILEGFHQPLSGPNIQSISTMVSYSGKTCLWTAALPNADDLQLLPLSSPHQTALLFAGSLTFPKGASEDQAIHFFGIWCSATVGRLLKLSTDAQLSSSA